MTLEFHPLIMKMAYSLATSEFRYGTFGQPEGHCVASIIAARIFDGKLECDEAIADAKGGDIVADRAIRLAAKAGYRSSAVTDYLSDNAIDGSPKRAPSRPKAIDRPHRAKAVYFMVEAIMEQARLYGLTLTRQRQHSDHTEKGNPKDNPIAACALDYVIEAIAEAETAFTGKWVAPMNSRTAAGLYREGRQDWNRRTEGLEPTVGRKAT